MSKARVIFAIFIIGFLLNLIWENLHAPLFEGFTNFWDHFMMCFWASLVDAATILLLYGLVALWYRDFYWIFKFMNWQVTMVLIIAGGAIAVGFEYWAFAIDYWTYTERMPVVPYLGIGLSPLLQMMLLPLFTFVLVALLFKSRKNRKEATAV